MGDPREVLVYPREMPKEVLVCLGETPGCCTEMFACSRRHQGGLVDSRVLQGGS